MPLSRSSILRGPAVITFNGATFYSKDDIKLITELDTFDIEISAFGKIDERVRNRKITVSFTPSGAWTDLATLFPYAAMPVGSSLFPTDNPLVIQTLAGSVLSFAAAAITKMPGIFLSAHKTLLGQLEFTCIGRDNTPWNFADSAFAAGNNAFSDTGFVQSGVITQAYTVAWGVVPPWSALSTQDGVAIEFDLGLARVETDAEGLVDMTFEKLAAGAKMKPLGLTESQVLAALALQANGAVRGRSLNTGGQPLAINGVSGAVNVLLNGANLKTAHQLFSATALRIDEIAFVATRNFSTGAPSPLFTVS